MNMELDKAENENPKSDINIAYMTEYSFDLDTMQVSTRKLSNTPQEFPLVN